MTTRVGTNYTYGKYGRAIADLHSKTTDTQRKMSGEKYNLFSEMGKSGLIKESMDMTREYMSSEAYMRNAQMVKIKTEGMIFATENLLEIAQNMKEYVSLNFNSAVGSLSNLKVYAEESLDYIYHIMNVNISGDFIFSGSKVNVRPIQNISTPNFNLVKEEYDYLEGDSNTDYFYGDFIKKSAPISESINLTYGFTAGEGGISQLIGAMHLILKSDRCGDEYMSRSILFLQESMDKISHLQSLVRRDNTMAQRSIKYNGEIMDNMLEKQEDINKLDSLDLANLLIKHAEYSNMLSASMQMYSSYSKLSLMNYLR